MFKLKSEKRTIKFLIVVKLLKKVVELHSALDIRGKQKKGVHVTLSR